MDEIGDSLRGTLRMANVSLFKEYGIEPSALVNGYVPVDIDISPFIDEKCSKEGVSKIYKCKDGYAPIFAYIGTEGYLLACELREGKQHCQKNTPAFLTEVLRLAWQVTDKPLLFRLDSGNDSADNIGLFMEECFQGTGSISSSSATSGGSSRRNGWPKSGMYARTSGHRARGKRNTSGRRSGIFPITSRTVHPNQSGSRKAWEYGQFTT